MMYGSQYVTNTPTLRKMLATNFSVHPDDEDQEAPWLQNPWRKDVTASTREI